jgi:hypothetical protein
MAPIVGTFTAARRLVRTMRGLQFMFGKAGECQEQNDALQELQEYVLL